MNEDSELCQKSGSWRAGAEAQLGVRWASLPRRGARSLDAVGQ